MPNIPDIKPDINLSKKDIANLLLSSIAMEELGLAEIIKAQGRKLEKITKETCDINVLLEANSNVNQLLKTIVKKEMLLLMKLESVVDFTETHEVKCKKHCKHEKECECECECEYDDYDCK
ncbi:hypothetical protein ACIQ7N_20700 [Lysinibacillus sp. NPDC095746]|uniref:hypothetical protein n=1 Tax=Lysinibacillus sp. NPDC095746 TaxID=3364134 RepID=UPI0038128A12